MNDQPGWWRPRTRAQTRLEDWEIQFIKDHAALGSPKKWVARNLGVSINTVKRYWNG